MSFDENDRIRLLQAVRTVPDFPKPGIQFKDITPILSDPDLLRLATKGLVAPLTQMGIDKVVGIESRGFIFGPLMADRLGAGFVPVRKSGKLPGATLSVSYELEYGTASIGLHEDAIQPGDRVLIHDDVIATGGTAAAAATLVEQAGGVVVGFSFLASLDFLDGQSQLGGKPVSTVLNF